MSALAAELSAFLTSIPVSIVGTGILVGVAASVLGAFLVLRGASMLSDAISHSIVLGIVLVWLAFRIQSGPVAVAGAALAGVLTVVLTEALARTRRVRDDTAIGLVFPALFAAGVLLLNLYARDVHVDTHAVLLGEIGFVWLDVVAPFGIEVPRAFATMLVVALIDVAFVTLFYKELKLATFDDGLASALGLAPAALFYALLTLTSVTSVAAFDAVGAVMFIAFVIVPPAAAYLLTDRLWRMIAYGAGIATASSGIGYALAVAWDVSIGGMMASVTGAFLALAFLLGPRHGLLAREIRRAGRRGAIDVRALAVHLARHEHESDAAQENAVAALHEHLRWDEERARRVLLRALDERVVRRDGQALRLEPRGRALAKEVLEPGAG